MEEFLNTIMSNNVYIGIVVVIAVILLIAIIKKVIKLIFTLVIIAALFGGYLYYTGEDLSSTDEIFKTIKDAASDIKNKGEELIDEVTED